MKKLFLSLIAMVFAVSMMAQDSRVATLQHGANFRTYYGTDAFISAHADAADGDVITLTEGEFKGCDITKAVTIRGEGMNKTVLSKDNSGSINLSSESTSLLSLEGLTIDYSYWGSDSFYITGTNGSVTVIISNCAMIKSDEIRFQKCSVIIMDSDIKCPIYGGGNSSITCINSRLNSLNSMTYDVNNCVITGNVNVTNSIIKNSIVCDVSTLDNTNTTSNCLVKEGSSGFANSWYVKTEPDVNPDPWGEDPETPVLWADLFGEDYHLTDAAASTYLGTDGTQVGIYGGAYPYDETPDYPLVKNLEVKGIHEDGKLQVKINVE